MRTVITAAITAALGVCLLAFATHAQWPLLYSALAIALMAVASARVAVIVWRGRNTQGAESGRALDDLQELKATMPPSRRGPATEHSDAEAED